MNHANALVADLVVSQPKVKFLLAYFGVAFGFTWLFWGLAIAVSTGQLVVPLPMFALMVLGGLGPMVAAIAMTALEQGARGVRDLFGQLLRFRVRWKWYVVALVLLPFLRLLPAFSHLALGGELPAQALTEQLMALPFFFVFVALLGGGHARLYRGGDPGGG